MGNARPPPGSDGCHVKPADRKRWLTPSPALAVDDVGTRSSATHRRESANRQRKTRAAPAEESAATEKRVAAVLVEETQKRRRG